MSRGTTIATSLPRQTHDFFNIKKKIFFEFFLFIYSIFAPRGSRGLKIKSLRPFGGFKFFLRLRIKYIEMAFVTPNYIITPNSNVK